MGTRKILGMIKILYYLNCGSGYMVVRICQNSLSCILKMDPFISFPQIQQSCFYDRAQSS